MWRWTPPSKQEGLLVLVHGPDRRNHDDSTRRVFFRRIADKIRRYEGKRQHERTLITGDFNAHPFESAIADCDGLHALGVRSLGSGPARKIATWRRRAEFLLQPHVAHTGIFRIERPGRQPITGSVPRRTSWAGSCWIRSFYDPVRRHGFRKTSCASCPGSAAFRFSTTADGRTNKRHRIIFRLSFIGICSQARNRHMPDLWPDFAGKAVPRGMYQMLNDAAGDIREKTAGAIEFRVDPVGVGAGGAIERIRFNCYLRVVATNYLYLLFRVIAPVAGPFPATVQTPEGEKYPEIADEPGLLEAIAKILHARAHARGSPLSPE